MGTLHECFKRCGTDPLSGYNPHCDCDHCVWSREQALRDGCDGCPETRSWWESHPPPQTPLPKRRSMAWDTYNDFILPIIKANGAFDAIHGKFGRNMPTLDEASCLPFFAREHYQAKMSALYSEYKGHKAWEQGERRE